MKKVWERREDEGYGLAQCRECWGSFCEARQLRLVWGLRERRPIGNDERMMKEGDPRLYIHKGLRLGSVDALFVAWPLYA